MFPPTKRCVMMWGFSRPESSVWMWYAFPLCLMLWLKPTTIFFASTPIGSETVPEGRGASNRPPPGKPSLAARASSDVDVLGRVHGAPEEPARDGEELLGRVRHEEPVLGARAG